MLKKSLLLGLLLGTFLLPGLTKHCVAQEDKGEPYAFIETQDSFVKFQNCLDGSQNRLQDVQNGTREATRSAEEFHHLLFIPYNIMDGSWMTGLNINCDIEDGDSLLIGYISDGETYWVGKLETEGRKDYTFLVDQLLPVDIKFRSPTWIGIFSEKGRFTVSQFLMNGSSGFGFQTFYSGPTWP